MDKLIHNLFTGIVSSTVYNSNKKQIVVVTRNVYTSVNRLQEIMNTLINEGYPVVDIEVSPLHASPKNLVYTIILNNK